MTDVYNRTVFERNSIQEVPAGYIDGAANDLFRFLGSFWKNIHEGTAFVRGVQQVRGIRLAQFYLDLLESLKLQDRRGAPVFHRELWKPLIIRKSTQNRAQENILELGDGISLGPQPAGSRYGEGTELHIGTLAGLDGYVTYPVEGDIKAIVSGIANNVINPTVAYPVGQEFPDPDKVVYLNGTLIFPKDKDPFAPGSGFEPYDVGDIVEGEADQELVVWASDVLIDKEYIVDHMSYALGVSCPSEEVAKRIVNAGWDALNCGLTPELFRTILGALVNIPVVQEAEETVKKIAGGDGENYTVTTDRHVYTVYGGAKLRDCVSAGAVLHRGDLLDQSVKIYPLLTDLSGEKLENTTEYAAILEEDVPVISIPRALLRTRTANGLFVDWTPTDVLWDGDLDANEHRKLYFDLGGPAEDVRAFWEDVWAEAERNDVDLDEIFAGCDLEDSSSSYSLSSSSDSPGAWKIVPAAFFLQNMLGANTLIVTLDRSQVEDTSLIRDPMFFNLLNRVVPSGMRLFFIEHLAAGDDGDDYDLAARAEDEGKTFVQEDVDEDEFAYGSLPGMRGKRIPTYEDQVEMKFLRNRKRSAN